MNKYEELLDIAKNDGITVSEKFDFSETRFKGLYCDGVIAINQQIKTNTERAGILAEELGHHYTTYGNILDLTDIQNLKQEQRARLWAYNKMIGLTGIINAYKRNCRSLPEMAEYFEVTEEFLQEALECYRQKYGISCSIDNYVIVFEPSLAVIEMIAK